MGILDEDVQRVRESTDLVALAGEHLALKRVGRSVSGLCPFHTEKSPSFTISPEKQVFYCLAGETRVLTSEGVREIRDLAGGVHRVLTAGSKWVDAPFSSFGVQPLMKIELTRNRQTKTLFATPEHRWFLRTGAKGRVRRERTTQTLEPGDALWCTPSPELARPALPHELFGTVSVAVESATRVKAALMRSACTRSGVRTNTRQPEAFQHGNWIVRSVETTDRVEEVFCAVVDGTHAFVLEDNILTGNCFGCQKSGDAITFVRELEHLDFVEAVERLAGRAGITLRYDDASVGKDRKRKQRLHEAVGAAITYYHQLLLESDDAGTARRYLRSRGFEGDIARRFSLGWSPDNWDSASQHLQKLKFSRDDILDVGLAFVNKANKLQDSFRGRVMFPIWDARGEPVGFGGRALDAQGPKYKNTAETTLYQKSRLLYGLHWAKGEIVARGEVIICEGYTDVMAFALSGVPNAVATCGTALADEHFLTLKNLARKVTLAYDADNAGQAAAERCYQWEQRYEVQFQVADLAAGRDPADVWRDDPAALVSAVKGATPFLEFRIERLLSAADLSTFEGRASAGERAVAMIIEHPNDLVRDQYVMQLSDRLDIAPDRLRATVTSALNRPHTEPARRSRPPAAAVVDRRELDALRWAVQHPELMSGRLTVDLFADPIAREAFDSLTQWPWHECLENARPEVASLLQRLAVEEPEAGPSADEGVIRVVVNLVEASSRRLQASMLRENDPRVSEIKSLLDALANARGDEQWETAERSAEQLVTWITELAE